MDLLHRFMTQLDLSGISYVEQDNSVQLILCSGSHKWKCAVTAEDSGYLCIYSRYPWSVPEERTTCLLRELNALNTGIAEGCFMLSEGQVILRCSVYAADALLFADIAQQHFSSAAALTEWAWNRIFSVLHSSEV
ncbi:MAG: hypothetical protein ACI4JY_05220 [Oscillospiraceae bacterium]